MNSDEALHRVGKRIPCFPPEIEKHEESYSNEDELQDPNNNNEP